MFLFKFQSTRYAQSSSLYISHFLCVSSNLFDNHFKSNDTTEQGVSQSWPMSNWDGRGEDVPWKKAATGYGWLRLQLQATGWLRVAQLGPAALNLAITAHSS